MTGQNSDSGGGTPNLVQGATMISTRSSDLAKLNPKCYMNYSIIFTEMSFYPVTKGIKIV